MDDLIAFLRARLDEDERMAQAAKDVAAERTHYRASVMTRADRELREVEAKRRIIELHELTVSKDPARFSALTGERLPDAYEVTCAVCGWADDDSTSGCETLRLLALPYVDHPAYREEWRP